MKIAFLGYKNSYDYNKVGGTDAIVKRISNYLSKNNEIYLLLYGYNIEQKVEIKKNIFKLHFKSIDDLLNFIKKEQIMHSISIYLKPIDRGRLFIFRKKNKNLFFHTLVTVYHESFFKRNLLFFESALTYNGNIYCVSKRIYYSIKKINKNTILFFPPVDDDFFYNNKKNNKKIRIGYMGRLDYGKGADIAYNYFLKTRLNRNKYEFYMYSYPWKNDKFSYELHNKLKKQNQIKYIETKLLNDPDKIDNFIKRIIDETDLFFLPYRFMSSTIDSPLVPLELMARNTPFISTKLKAIEDISYMKNNLLNLKDINKINIIDELIKENIGLNVYDKAIEMKYRTSDISKLLLLSLEKFNG